MSNNPVSQLNRRSDRYSKLYQVRSFSSPSAAYVVALRADSGSWECSCPAWTRHTPRKNCKHINLVLQQLYGPKPNIPAAAPQEILPATARALSRFGLLDVGV